jgi:hypothetical protein
MTFKDKIKPLLVNIDSIVSKDKPATFALEGYEFEIRKTKMFVRHGKGQIMYKSKRGFSREKIETIIDDAVDYFKRVDARTQRRLKKKGIK